MPLRTAARAAALRFASLKGSVLDSGALRFDGGHSAYRREFVNCKMQILCEAQIAQRYFFLKYAFAIKSVIKYKNTNNIGHNIHNS